MIYYSPPEKELEIVAVDTEWFGQQKEKLHRPHGTFAMLSMSDGVDIWVCTDIDKVKDFLSMSHNYIMYNALYDLRQLEGKGVPVMYYKLYDTMLIEQGLWGGYYDGFSLADCVRRYLNIRMDKTIRSEFTDATSMTQEMIEYGAQDALLTFKVYEAQKKLPQYEDYMSVYEQIDGAMIEVVMDMKPVKIDRAHWMELVTGLEAKGKEIEERLGVNVYSHVKVKEWFLAHHNITLENTEAETLMELGPISDDILLARMCRKATSTYGEKWLDKHVEADDLVWADWHINGASTTGRMSCSSPGLQQIPSRKIPEYREMFIARRELIIDTDVSAQEPHILAWHSKDKELIDIFESGRDVHLEVARAATGDMEMEKSDPRRSEIGKMLNLATSYGMSAQGLAKRTGKSEQEAKDFLDGYFKRFKGVFMFIQRQHAIAQQKGYVSTAMGRRSWINPYAMNWENNAINSPIQGGAADFTKRWCVLFHGACMSHNVDFPLTMIIHDELVCDVLKEDAEITKKLLLDAFNKTAEELYPGVKFTLDMKEGDSWACKH